MKRKYISESHRKYSEACQKEVEEMSKHPLTAEEKQAQMDRNMQLSIQRAKQAMMPEEENTPSLPGEKE